MRQQKIVRHIALLYAAARAHEDWELIAGDNGEPCAVRNMSPGAWPNTPKELAEWFVDAFPEEAAKILTGKTKILH